MDQDSPADYLALADWRRRVAKMWQEWRIVSGTDGPAATQAFRDAKDRLFLEHPQSPVPAAQRPSFTGLPYWPYDAALRMTVRLDPPPPEVERSAAFASLAAIALPSSGSGGIPFRRIGRVQLSGPLAGSSLDVFWIDAYGGGIFLPFRDATSGSETYGAGRYLLDTIKSADHGGDHATGELLLDFNMAFHPSCAHDPKWACPLAPPENRLSVPVRVGERLASTH
ncbi:MAG: DUF1684 domain-containing protein [Chloroflexi bacterium]|nr:DUF1684 domain-containing protein [Chloroflexota bacterium]